MLPKNSDRWEITLPNGKLLTATIVFVRYRSVAGPTDRFRFGFRITSEESLTLKMFAMPPSYKLESDAVNDARELLTSLGWSKVA